MFKLVDYKIENGVPLFGIKDTNDGVVEYHTRESIRNICSHPIGYSQYTHEPIYVKISGFNEDTINRLINAYMQKQQANTQQVTTAPTQQAKSDKLTEVKRIIEKYMSEFCQKYFSTIFNLQYIKLTRNIKTHEFSAKIDYDSIPYDDFVGLVNVLNPQNDSETAKLICTAIASINGVSLSDLPTVSPKVAEHLDSLEKVANLKSIKDMNKLLQYTLYYYEIYCGARKNPKLENWCALHNKRVEHVIYFAFEFAVKWGSLSTEDRMIEALENCGLSNVGTLLELRYWNFDNNRVAKYLRLLLPKLKSKLQSAVDEKTKFAGDLDWLNRLSVLGYVPQPNNVYTDNKHKYCITKNQNGTYLLSSLITPLKVTVKDSLTVCALVKEGVEAYYYRLNLNSGKAKIVGAVRDLRLGGLCGNALDWGYNAFAKEKEEKSSSSYKQPEVFSKLLMYKVDMTDERQLFWMACSVSPLNNNDLAELLDDVYGQCTDGWGEDNCGGSRDLNCEWELGCRVIPGKNAKFVYVPNPTEREMEELES